MDEISRIVDNIQISGIIVFFKTVIKKYFRNYNNLTYFCSSFAYLLISYTICSQEYILNTGKNNNLPK